jgi:hypothetical protein
MKNINWKPLSIAILAITFVLLPLAGCGGQTNAADFEYKTNPKKANQEVIITGYTGVGKTVSIPARIGGKTVSVIGEGALEEKGLTGVTIPNSVTEIDYRAFSGNQLTSVTIGEVKHVEKKQ